MGKPRKSGGSIIMTIPVEIARVKGWTEKDVLTLAFMVMGPTTKVDNTTPVIVVETQQKVQKDDN